MDLNLHSHIHLHGVLLKKHKNKFSFILVLTSEVVGPVAQSVWRLFRGWTVRGSNPGGARFFAIQTGPGAHPAYCTTDTGSLPVVESGRGVTLTPHPLLVSRSENIAEL